MKRGKVGFGVSFLGITMFCLFAVAQTQAGLPVVTIESPIEGATYSTKDITISGTVLENGTATVKRVWWTNNRNPGVEVNAPSSTEWDHDWLWEDTVSLVEGVNEITVYAQDVAGNMVSDTVTVIYQIPPPPPPPQTAKTLDIRQGKFTFYFGTGSGSAASDPVYNGIDRVSTVGYLQKSASETFVMPYNTDVTVTLEAPDPRDANKKLRLFTQTIPAGTVTSTGKYRYVHSGGGIYEFLLQSYTSTTVYMYVFVDRVNFLLDIKSSMTPDQYWQFVRSISSYSVTIQIGDIAWVGSAHLVPGTYSYHKQELVYNR